MNYREYFKGKKVTVMGLGLLGRAIGDVKFLLECGSVLTITDLKKEEELLPALNEIKTTIESLKEKGIVCQPIEYKLGGHTMEDFRNKDLILKNAGVPIDSPYIAQARKNNIPVEMDESLFAKLAPPITIVGITGTRGKTTTTMLIYEILSKAFPKVYLGGNIRGLATLPLLHEVVRGDIIVMELSSWQLQGFNDAKISPQIAVFTNFLNDHLNYYKDDVQKYFDDKATIFKYQTSNNFLVTGNDTLETIKTKINFGIKSKIVLASPQDVPASWKLKIKGYHNEENVALAKVVGEVLKIDESVIKQAVEEFKGAPGRLEHIRTFNGVEIYNDTTSTTPDATLVALKSLASNKNIILILGGSDKCLDMSILISNISQYAKAVVMLPGSGSLKIHKNILSLTGIAHEHAHDLTEALKKALDNAREGDVVLFSPGFASFGMFKNEFDRGDQFIKAVEELK